MNYELKKLFAKPASRILLAVMALLAVLASVFAVGGMTYVDESGNEHSGIEAARLITAEKNTWKGDLEPQVLEKAVSQVQKNQIRNEENKGDREGALSPFSLSCSDIKFLINGMLSGDGEYNPDAVMALSPEEAGKLYQIREANISKLIQQEENSHKRDFLERKYKEIQTPFYYEGADSWKTLFLYTRIYILAVVALVGFFGAGIFADEFRLKADTIFFSSRNGRKKAVKNKIRAGLLMAAIVYWGGMLLLTFLSLAAMGTSGADTPIQIENAYNLYDVTYGKAYGMILVGGFVASLLSAAMAMLTAAKSRSYVLAAAVPLLIFCVLPFIGLASGFDTLFSLTPDQLANLNVCIGLSLIYEIKGIVFRQIPFIIAFYGILSFAALPLVYRVYSRYRLG